MNNTGATLIISPIRPLVDSDIYPVAYAEELRGGHHQVKNESARLNIPKERLKEGMLVSVINTNRTYQYTGGTFINLNFEFLQNIDLSSVTNNQVLTYNSSTGTWINKEIIGSLYETGSTILPNGSTTGITIGNKTEDRGMTIDYTLYRSGITEKYQIGKLYVIHDNQSIKLSDEYVTTGDFKIVEFDADFDGFTNNIINLLCIVSSDIYDVEMNYHLKKIKF